MKVEYDDCQTYHVLPRQLESCTVHRRVVEPALDEEKEARKQLSLLEAEEVFIAREKAEVQAILTQFEAERYRRAKEEAAEKARLAIALEKKLLQEIKKVVRAKEKEKEIATREKDNIRLTNILERIVRGSSGRYITYSLSHSEFVNEHFDETVTCVALGGDATIMLHERGDTMWTSGLHTSLYNKLNGRQKSLPTLEYVSIGSEGRYYV